MALRVISRQGGILVAFGAKRKCADRQRRQFSGSAHNSKFPAYEKAADRLSSPVITALLANWPLEKLKQARETGSLLEASEVASVVMFMLTRPRGMTIRDVVMMPTNFDL